MEKENLKEKYEEAKQFVGCIKEESNLYLKVANILKEYEGFISFLENTSNTSAVMKQEKIRHFFQNGTLRNLNESKIDLENKLLLVDNDNERLATKISTIKRKKDQIEGKKNLEIEAMRVKHLEGKGCTGLTEMALCKKLKMHQTKWAEKDALIEKLQDLNAQNESVEQSLRKWFVPKKKYQALFEQVLQKESYCEALGMINKTLKTKVKRLKVAIEAAEISAYHGYHFPTNKGNTILSVVDKFVNSEATTIKNNIENAERFESDIIGEEEQKFLQEFVFLKGYVGNGNGEQDEESSLKNRLKTISRPKSFDVKKSFTDDDPLKEQEAEMTMDYVEVFSNLFSAEEYEKAATHAIYSPKGILRTQQTLQYFKNIDNKIKNTSQSPSKTKSFLLHYCTLLLSTVSVVGKDPTVWEVIESFRSAINENRLDLVEFWIAEAKVFIPEPVANLLMRACKCQPRNCKCSSVSLAEVVFRKLGRKHELINLLLHQGRLATAVHCAQKIGKFSTIHYARMLEESSTCDRLSQLIVDQLQRHECKQVIVSLVCGLKNENAMVLVKKLNAKEPLLFIYKDFIEWQGSLFLSEQFGNQCGMEGLNSVGASFIAACMVWFALDGSKNVLWSTS